MREIDDGSCSGYDAVADYPYGSFCTRTFSAGELASSTACIAAFNRVEYSEVATSTFTTTWAFGGVTATETRKVPIAPSGFDRGEPKTLTVTLDEDGHPPTSFPDDGPEGLEMIFNYMNDEARESGWVGNAYQPMLMFINNGSGSDGNGTGADGNGNDDSAASAAFSSLLTVGGALFAALIAVAAL